MPDKEWTAAELEQLIERGELDAAYEGLVWFWANDNWDKWFPHFLKPLAAAARTSPKIRAHFTAVRDAATPKTEDGRPGIREWATLNDVLGEEALTYHWIDDRIAQGAVPIIALNAIRRRILQRGRPGDLLSLIESPMAAIEDIEEMRHFHERQFGDVSDVSRELDEHDWNTRRVELALIFRAVAAVRPNEAADVRSAITRLDAGDEMNRLLGLSYPELCTIELSR